MLLKTRVAIRFRAKKPSPQTARNFALEGLWCGRTFGRAGRRAVYGHVIAKFITFSYPSCSAARASRVRAPLESNDLMVRLNPTHFFGEEKCSSICPKKSTGNSIIQMVSPLFRCCNRIICLIWFKLHVPSSRFFFEFYLKF